MGLTFVNVPACLPNLHPQPLLVFLRPLAGGCHLVWPPPLLPAHLPCTAWPLHGLRSRWHGQGAPAPSHRCDRPCAAHLCVCVAADTAAARSRGARRGSFRGIKCWAGWPITPHLSACPVRFHHRLGLSRHASGQLCDPACQPAAADNSTAVVCPWLFEPLPQDTLEQGSPPMSTSCAPGSSKRSACTTATWWWRPTLLTSPTPCFLPSTALCSTK